MAQPIVPWLGGKRRLADTLLHRFPPHTCYVELFAGGAALFFLRPPAEVEVINDANGELINLYRVVARHLEEFVRQFKWSLSSREVFKWLQQTPPHVLTDIGRPPMRSAAASCPPLPAALSARSGFPSPEFACAHRNSDP